MHHHTPSVVLWNESDRRGHWLEIRLRGRAPNPDAVGARLTVRVEASTLTRTVDGGGSYIWANDARVHFGLGGAERVDRLEVRWPSGRTGVRTDIPADGLIEWSEGETSPVE